MIGRRGEPWTHRALSSFRAPGEPHARTHITRTDPEVAPCAADAGGPADRGGTGDPAVDRFDGKHAGDGAGKPFPAGRREVLRADLRSAQRGACRTGYRPVHPPTRPARQQQADTHTTPPATPSPPDATPPPPRH